MMRSLSFPILTKHSEQVDVNPCPISQEVLSQQTLFNKSKSLVHRNNGLIEGEDLAAQLVQMQVLKDLFQNQELHGRPDTLSTRSRVC